MMLFTGNACQSLSTELASHLNLSIGKAIVSRFSDGEIRVEITEHVRGCDVFILQSTNPPADNLMELLLLTDALRRASANSITAVIPYYGYARQDRRLSAQRVPISAKVCADLIHSVGINRILTVDLHADQIQGFFYIPVDNVYSTDLIVNDIKNKKLDNVVLVSPDIGGVVRARAIAKRLNNAQLAIIDKRRPEPNQSSVMHLIGKVKNANCIIIDDIIDTGGTLLKATEALKKQGANSVIAYVIHPVLSDPAIQNVDKNDSLDELIVCDTIEVTDKIANIKKIRKLSIANILAKAIQRVHKRQSLSSMFD